MATKEDILSSFQVMLPGHVVDKMSTLGVDNDACFWAADHKSYTSTELRLQKFVDGAVEISIRVMKLGGTTNMNKRSQALNQSNFVRSSVYGKDKMNREVQPQGRYVYQKTLNCIGTVKKKSRGRPANQDRITRSQIIDHESSQGIVHLRESSNNEIIEIQQQQHQQQQQQQHQQQQQQLQQQQQQQQQQFVLQQQQQQQNNLNSCIINAIPANTTVQHNQVIVNNPYRLVTKPQMTPQHMPKGQIITVTNMKGLTTRNPSTHSQIITIGQQQQNRPGQAIIANTAAAVASQPQQRQFVAQCNHIGVATIAQQNYLQQQQQQQQYTTDDDNRVTPLETDNSHIMTHQLAKQPATNNDDSLNPGDFLLKVIKEGITQPQKEPKTRKRHKASRASLRVLSLRRNRAMPLRLVHKSQLPTTLMYRNRRSLRCRQCSESLTSTAKPLTAKIRLRQKGHTCSGSMFTSHKCRKCTHKFQSFKEMREHVQIAHRWRSMASDAPFRCDLCEEMFYLQNNYVQHRISTHPTEVDLTAEVECVNCTQMYKDSKTFVDHNCTAKPIESL